MEKERNCSLLPVLDFHVKSETRFSLRDKRLFEISAVEITVDCSSDAVIYSYVPEVNRFSNNSVFINSFEITVFIFRAIDS